MCGIIGIIGRDAVAGPLLEALKRLEYRGYDSAGIATLVNGGIERRRAKGKLENLAGKIAAEPNFKGIAQTLEKHLTIISFLVTLSVT